MIEKSDMHTQNHHFESIPLETATASSEYTINSTKSQLTYKDLNDTVFFWTTVILQIGIMTMALTIEDIDVIFDFIGVIGCASQTFLFPSVAYLLAVNKYSTSRQRKKWETTIYQILSYIFLILYFSILGAYVYI